jgi:ribose-phosphate pyrophosphokinase
MKPEFATINFPQGAGVQFEMFRYPGGEVQVRLTDKQIRILKTVQEVHVQARISDGEIMAVSQLIDAIRGVIDIPVKLILPYLPYGRADRRFREGDCDGLAVFSKMLAMTGAEIVTLDAHSDKAKRNILNLTDVSPIPIIETAINTIETDGPVVGILLPDAGAARYGLKSSLVAEKKRDPETGKLTEFKVPPKQAFEGLDSVLIVDDICDGGGTFLGIAEAMKDYGLDLYLYVTHGIFSKGFTDLLKVFKRIYTTDSFQTPLNRNLVVIPCMGTILDQIVDRPALYENAYTCGTAKAARAANEAILKKEQAIIQGQINRRLDELTL